LAGYFGGDPDQMRTLARAFEQAAQRLENVGREVSSRLSGTPWAGPDADRYRSQWHGESLAKMRGVVSALHDAAAALQRNASEQEKVSSAAGGASSSGPLPTGTPQGGLANPLVGIGKWLDDSTIWPIQNGTAMSWTPLGDYVPLMDAAGLAADTGMDPKDKLIDASGQLIDLGGGQLRSEGFEKGNLPMYLGGVATSQWGDVATNFAKADFSASTLQSNADYIATDPGGAFDAAKDAVVGYIPKLVSNWNPF
jgi:uncharacterized protein YukE